jgi:hypothetical protein
MTETALFTPRNRQNLPEWLDKINALKNSINFKLELDKQISLQNKLINSLSKKPIALSFARILFPNCIKIIFIRREVEISKLRTSNENNLKQSLVYHKNELLLEDDMEEVYEELGIRYEAYISELMSLYEKVKFGSKKGNTLPDKDIKMLVTKFQSQPPAIKTEKLSFYLTMEQLLYRCSKA